MTYRYLIDEILRNKTVIELGEFVSCINEFYNNKGCHVDVDFIKKFRDILLVYYDTLEKKNKIVELMYAEKKHPDEEIDNFYLEKILNIALDLD